MDDSKFNSFMNDVMAHKDIADKNGRQGYDFELGDKKDEILALHTEQHISRRIIFDSLVKSGIISEDKPFKGFTQWMGRSIKRNSELNTEENKKVYRVQDGD